MGADTRIRFEQGSSMYDAGAEIFRFGANDDQGPVRCAISREAFEKVSGLTHVEADTANLIFNDWESTIFDVARGKYDRGERQISGSIMIRIADVKR